MPNTTQKSAHVRLFTQQTVTTQTPTPEQRRAWEEHITAQTGCTLPVARRHIAAVLAGEGGIDPIKRKAPAPPPMVAVRIQLPAIDGATWVLERFVQRWVRFHSEPAHGQTVVIAIAPGYRYREVVQVREWSISDKGELSCMSTSDGCQIVSISEIDQRG